MATNVLQSITFKLFSHSKRGGPLSWVDPKAEVCFHHPYPGTRQWISSPCTACWQSPPNFSSVWMRCGWQVIPFIYLTGLSECCAAILKGAGGCTLCFLWLNCALPIPSQNSSSVQCLQSFAAWGCDDLVGTLCFLPIVLQHFIGHQLAAGLPSN